MLSYNKHVLNKITRRIANSSHGPFAVVTHFGRKSGKSYKTPIIAHPMPRGFVVALTYGPNVDWYRNVSTAGRCILKWHSKEYAIQKLEKMDLNTAMPLFSKFERSILRQRGTQDFVKMIYQT